MSMVQSQFEFLQDTLKLMDFIMRHGFVITYGEVYRTREQQQIYFNTGRSKTMNSRHLERMALDLNFFLNGRLVNDPEILAPIGRLWMSLNPKNRWGGDWNRNGDVRDENWHDTPHFERMA
ncbi:MAG: M15 family metallopeptidase [Candidatus Marinimicrobia bacterium]|jgi:hypothetical protein|nr:M15 family metallopeptidase [Candidatus Neomarinimicrobiota bacterium]